MKEMKGITAILITTVALTACQKYTDTPGVDDPRLHGHKYCNTPDAVNYNWDFPGDADSTVCFFPSDVFKGHYSFVDSIYNSDGTALLRQDTLQLNISPLSRTAISLQGFCGTAGGVRLTATRTFRAQVDTLIPNGQALCRPLDTLSGTITTAATDTAHLRFTFTVVSDTGSTQHRGTARRQ